MITSQQLQEVYLLVWNTCHSPGFKESETKQLLFDPKYRFFTEMPISGWYKNILDYFDNNNLDKSKLNISKELINYYK